MCTLTYELAPNSAAAAAGKVRRRRQPNFGLRGSVRRRASRIWSAPAGKRTAARLRGLPGSTRGGARNPAQSRCACGLVLWWDRATRWRRTSVERVFNRQPKNALFAVHVIILRTNEPLQYRVKSLFCNKWNVRLSQSRRSRRTRSNTITMNVVGVARFTYDVSPMHAVDVVAFLSSIFSYSAVACKLDASY